ncbi:TPA: MarR family transcriptional regulator, partial [Staphylococcus aureus]|nr:MarR family transcriptional regulator [Staphylococcus aureus]
NLKEFDITYPQFLVLNILWQENTTNVKTIVNSLGLDTGTISPLLKRMENKGLIKRQRSDLDQREVFLYLTEKSIEIANSLDNVINENKAIASLSDSEIKEMNKLLLKILEDK